MSAALSIIAWVIVIYGSIVVSVITIAYLTDWLPRKYEKAVPFAVLGTLGSLAVLYFGGGYPAAWAFLATALLVSFMASIGHFADRSQRSLQRFLEEEVTPTTQPEY